MERKIALTLLLQRIKYVMEKWWMLWITLQAIIKHQLSNWYMSWIVLAAHNYVQGNSLILQYSRGASTVLSILFRAQP